jgi:hypothetical protein
VIPISRMRLARFSSHLPPFASERSRDLSRPIEGAFGIDLIDPMLQRHLFGRRWDGAIVEARAFHAQQVALLAQRKVRLPSLDPPPPLLSTVGRCQVF